MAWARHFLVPGSMPSNFDTKHTHGKLKQDALARRTRRSLIHSCSFTPHTHHTGAVARLLWPGHQSEQPGSLHPRRPVPFLLLLPPQEQQA